MKKYIKMKKIAIFASGSGSNAENIADYFKGNKEVGICAILTNKSDAYVLKRAEKLGIPSLVFDRNDFVNSGKILDYLKDLNIDGIILAGFLWKIPVDLINAFPDRIVNIHPALLPAYGGKGMYGMNIHKAVIENKEKESGITIHLVNEEYDKGAILVQARTSISATDSPEDLAQKIHELEYSYFPVAIESWLNGLK